MKSNNLLAGDGDDEFWLEKTRLLLIANLPAPLTMLCYFCFRFIGSFCCRIPAL